jgi:ribosomal protein S18 acetylase RimI-like enzyme
MTSPAPTQSSWVVKRINLADLNWKYVRIFCQDAFGESAGNALPWKKDDAYVIMKGKRIRAMSMIRFESPLFHFKDELKIPEGAYLYSFGVRFDSRRKGCGKALLNAMLADYPDMNLDVDIENEEAYEFYIKHGAEVVGTFKSNEKRYNSLRFGEIPEFDSDNESDADDDENVVHAN